VLKEGGMDAIDHRTHVNEIHGDISPGARKGRRRRHVRIQIRMPSPFGADAVSPAGRPHARGRAAVQESVESVEHLSCAEGRKQLAARSFVELGKIDRAVALVAQDFEERGPAFFRWGLELTVNDAKQMHLQRLDLEILCVTAVRTRK
jgi:hypothetical protein